ncbi:hypothetical protein CRG98_000724, partial [Punica granatum]
MNGEEETPGWKMYFDGVVNSTRSGIGAVLISPKGRHFPVAAKIDFPCTNNIAEYEASNFFLSGETLYRRSFDATLLRCVDENEAQRLMEEVHEGNCGPHMNGLKLAKKLMRLGYFWSTMETDYVKH